ncbi:MAG: family glycosyltransferase [Phycisphaerales bacterium]|nr:family glycosyltransferase [Phycisphaerales bacterium]
MKMLFYAARCAPGGFNTFIQTMYRSLGSIGIDAECYFERDEGGYQELSTLCRAHLGTVISLKSVLGTSKCEVIQTTLSSVDNGVLARKLRNIAWSGKVVVTAQGVVLPGWNSKNCFALTSVNRRQALELESMTDLKVDTIYNGVDTSLFSPSEYVGGAPIIAWVGRASDLPQKRFDLFALMVPHLKARGIRVWIADPEGCASVSASLREAILPHVELWKSVPRDRMPDFYRRVSESGGCVVSTTRYEGLSFALIEAQACGCPVVAATAVGVDESVRSEHGGVLYPPEITATELCDLVSTVISAKQAMAERREMCRRFIVDNFSQDGIAKHYAELYSRRSQTFSFDVKDRRLVSERARLILSTMNNPLYSFREDLAAVRSATTLDPSLTRRPHVWRKVATSILKLWVFAAIGCLKDFRTNALRLRNGRGRRAHRSEQVDSRR